MLRAAIAVTGSAFVLHFSQHFYEVGPPFAFFMAKVTSASLSLFKGDLHTCVIITMPVAL